MLYFIGGRGHIGFFPFLLDGFEKSIYLDSSNGAVDYDIFARGNFEPNILRLIRNNSTSEDIFFDVGANIGQHSLWASLFCKHVYAFEPITKLATQILLTCNNNELLNVSVYNFGFGSIKSIVPIYSNGSNMGASSVVISEGRKRLQDVYIFKFDDFVEKQAIEKVSLIKIDVEGYEYDVILGAHKTITKYKPKLIIEFSPIYYNKIDTKISKKLYNLLISYGYKIQIIRDDGSLIDVVNIKQIENESQTNLFCV